MSDKYILRSGAIDAIKRNSGTLYTREAEFLLQKVIFLLKKCSRRRRGGGGTWAVGA